MPRSSIGLAAIFCLGVGAGCVTATNAPGADRVRITHNPADVAECTAVGKVKVPRNAQGAVVIQTAATEFRNQTVGLGGNAALVTVGGVDVPVEGFAYRCR